MKKHNFRNKFQGETAITQKKPKNGEITETQKQENKNCLHPASV